MRILGSLRPFVGAVRWTIRRSSTAAQTADFEYGEKMTLPEQDYKRLLKLRNIGISAHIDSGKTTLTERVLYYTGRISEIHEVRGKDNVGAKMDSMDLEREKGITIQSAATYAQWKDCFLNIIDTPGHVDFTIEVERALRVLDGAVLVLCAVGGVQSQTLTVDRQMKRYNVPRIAFVNKMDRVGSNPFKVIDQIRTKLKLSAAAIQVPIGAEDEFKGVVDLVEWKAYYNEGEKGEHVVEGPVPEDLIWIAVEKRAELVETLAEVNDEIADIFLNEKEPSNDVLRKAIREATVGLKFTPVLMGSAYHNKGVQRLLEGVVSYLPAPFEVENYALDKESAMLDKDSFDLFGKKKVDETEESKEEATEMTDDESSRSSQEAPQEAKQVTTPQMKKHLLSNSSQEGLVALAFKLEEGRFGQLTYVRVYQGTLRKGINIFNARTGKKVKLSRVVRMHSNEMEEVEQVGSGEICALFGVDCASGDTFTDGTTDYTMTSMFVPKPVISLSIEPKLKNELNFSKALARFQREDPTFKVHIDAESKQTIISGMGELHLEIYVERMKREYKVETVTGKPQVAFREKITKRVKFEYTHKKQTGGSGQFARIKGYIEPMEESVNEDGEENDFINSTVGMNIPHNYIPAIEKGFKDVCSRGILVASPITQCRFVVEDGLAHAVDSSELAFRVAATMAVVDVYPAANPIILEPIMKVQMTCPAEYQNAAIGLLNRRRGVVLDSEVVHDYLEVEAEVSLNDMFGFSSDLRSVTQGKGEFSMEYIKYAPVQAHLQHQLVEEYRKKREEASKKKK